jgi:hypothetical protein
VSQLEVGDAIWVEDCLGRRTLRPIAELAQAPVLGAHHLLVVTLSDRRVVRASAGHPVRGGRRFEELALGDELDGARVVAIRSVSYHEPSTFDLRTKDPADCYFASAPSPLADGPYAQP